VACPSLGPQPHPEDSLLSDAQRVQAAAVVLDRHAAALVDDEVAADLLPMLLADPLGAEPAAGLLVRGEDEEEIA
jgi:hypothetical protein